MRELYFALTDLPGVPRGTVERFMVSRGESLVHSGDLERYDPSNATHRAAAEQAGYASARTTDSGKRFKQ